MKHTHAEDAIKSWSRWRKSFAHRASYFPELSLIPRLIDRIVDRGFASSLYASASHHNLVISDNGDWRRRSRSILVMPKESTFEVRYYAQGELVERSELSSENLFEELDRLLPNLLREAKQP